MKIMYPKDYVLYLAFSLKGILKIILQCWYDYSLLLNKQRQQHPLDNPQLIVFILGGITAQEVKLVQEMVISSGRQTQVLVGGTRLLSPNDTVEAIFIKDLFMQQVL